MTDEEELQHRMESGTPPSGDGADAQAYRHVFKALKHEPDFSLPASFADRVMKKIEVQRAKSSRRDYVWMGTGFFLLAAAFIVAVVASGFQLDFGFLRGLGAYKGLILFGAAFLILLQAVDKLLFHKRASSR